VGADVRPQGTDSLVRGVATALVACLLGACTPQVQERVEAPAPAPPPAPAPFPVWDRLAGPTTPERVHIREPYRYLHDLSPTGLKGVKCVTYRPGGHEAVEGFTLVNRGSERINPKGLCGVASLRSYKFLYPDRALENMYLNVTDDVAVSGRYSHDNMFRELHFFPRLQLPTVEKVADGRRLEVTLPTGEKVDFDARTKEIVGGVLREAPLDLNPNRHARHNPDIGYRGRNLMITVAQRGEAPRLARVWGQTKYAEVYYPVKYGKPCRVSPALIWEQRPKPGDTDASLTMLHPTDDTLFAMLERECRWDLRELALAASRVQGQATAALDEHQDGP